mmetsp:Transcript_23820/g.67470  ORF Transcript_23820/g.67470 Transcript_23820/m.67470 type:complete len:81 (+) Transcript_23820:1410-1652(+)
MVLVLDRTGRLHGLCESSHRLALPTLDHFGAIFLHVIVRRRLANAWFAETLCRKPSTRLVDPVYSLNSAFGFFWGWVVLN